jgi:hypothetical protein
MTTTNLPKTMTIEALKRVQRKLVLLLSFMTFRGGDSNLELALADLDQWIAELWPMEEPAPLSRVRFLWMSNELLAIRVDYYWFVAGYTKSFTWQEILAIDPNPKIIYTPKGEGE